MPKQKKPEQEKPALEEIADEDAEEREYARRESIKSRLLCTISGGFITSAGYVFLTSHIEYAHERAAIFQEQLSRAPELTAASYKAAVDSTNQMIVSYYELANNNPFQDSQTILAVMLGLGTACTIYCALEAINYGLRAVKRS